MIWLLWFDAAGAAWFVVGVVAEGAPYSRPHLPAFLTHRNHAKSGD